MQHQDLPIHDTDNDKTASEARKAACKIPYQDMTPADIDKIYSSAFVYDKVTKQPIAKKPRSLHELIWCMLQSQIALGHKIYELEQEIVSLKAQGSRPAVILP